MLGDAFAEPGAMVGFAGARVIEQTIRERLRKVPAGRYLRTRGMIDVVVPRPQQRATLARPLRC